MKLYAEAVKLAVERHGLQKHGDRPYIAHLMETAKVLSDFGYTSDEWQAAGVLHDIIEDTNSTRDELVDQFGSNVADLVWCVTGFGTNAEQWEEIKQKLLIHPQASPLKLADRIANTERGLSEKNAFYLNRYNKLMPEVQLYLEPHVPTTMWTRLENVFTQAKEQKII